MGETYFPPVHISSSCPPASPPSSIAVTRPQCGIRARHSRPNDCVGVGKISPRLAKGTEPTWAVFRFNRLFALTLGAVRMLIVKAQDFILERLDKGGRIVRHQLFVQGKLIVRKL